MKEQEAMRTESMARAELKNTEEIPSDLIIALLSRLPTKILMRFKCVSKQWYNWISDPSFLGQRSTKNPNFVYITCEQEPNTRRGIGFGGGGPGSCRLGFTSIDSQGNLLHQFTKEGGNYSNYSISYVYSCKGLICFNTDSRWDKFEQIYVCNPTTRELKLLPCSSRCQILQVPGGINPSITFGLGYLSSSQEYKVARLFWDDQRQNINCEVISLITRRVWGRNRRSSWRVVSERCPCKIEEQESVFGHGCLNWFANSDITVIVSFDLTSEKFRILPLPLGLEGKNNSSLGMVDLGGILSLVNRCDEKMWKLWILQDQDKCIWINAHNIDMSNYHPNLWSDIEIHTIRMVNGKLLMTCIVRIEDLYYRFFVYYDIENKKFGRELEHFRIGKVGVYNMEYLASL